MIDGDVRYVANVYSTGVGPAYVTRQIADQQAGSERTHVLTFGANGKVTLEEATDAPR